MSKNKKTACHKGCKGFTIIELIIVIAIMAVLAVLIAPSVARYIRKARAAKATEEARTIVMAVQNGIATNRAEDLPLLLDKTFKKSDGTSTQCGVITNLMLSNVQNGNVVNDTDNDYVDYLISKEILENLNAGDNNQYKFFRFNGNARNPIGMNCESFANTYKCPGLIVIYSPEGNVLFLQYYNYGCLIHYEDGEYTFSESEDFAGTSKIIY